MKSVKAKWHFILSRFSEQQVAAKLVYSFVNKTEAANICIFEEFHIMLTLTHCTNKNYPNIKIIEN